MNDITKHLNGSILGLPPLPPLFGEQNDESFSSISLVRPTNREEKRVRAELDKQLAVIRGIGEKGQLAHKMRAKAHYSSHAAYSDAVNQTRIIRAKHNGLMYEDEIEEMFRYSVKALARNLIGFEELIANVIGQELVRPVYQPELPLTVFEKIFGRKY